MSIQSSQFYMVRRNGIDYLVTDFDPDGRACFCVTTRRGGKSFGRNDLNLSYGTGDSDENVTGNRRSLFDAIGLEGSQAAGLRQIHSADVLVVNETNWDEFVARKHQADGLITNQKERWLAISIGDCLSVGIYDFENNVLAMMHAGWKGTALRIVESSLQKMSNDFGTDPGKCYAVISPGIGFSAYEVDQPVFDAFDKSWDNWEQFIIDKNDGRGFIDLTMANRHLLTSNGIAEENIRDFGLCTHTLYAMFFSHRRDGLPGGRMFALGVMR